MLNDPEGGVYNESNWVGARETLSFYFLVNVCSACSINVAPSNMCGSLKQKLPKVSPFYLASLVTVTLKSGCNVRHA